MRISNPSLQLYFPSESEPVITTSIVQNSISITEQLYSELSPSSNTVSLQIKPDDTDLIEDIIKENDTIKAVLYDEYDTEDEVILYTGYVSNNYSWQVSMTGEDVLQVKLEDIGTRLLNKPFVREDGTCIKDTFQNIVATIRSMCGDRYLVIYDSSVTEDIKTKELINKVDTSVTCEEVLQQICYELGLIYWFNNEGNLVIKRTNLEASPSTTVASTGTAAHYLYVEGNTAISLSKKAKQYSQVRVKYSTLQDSENPIDIYKVTDFGDGIPAGQWWDGVNHSESIYDFTLDEYFQNGVDYYTLSGTTYTKAIAGVDYQIGDPIPDETYYEYKNMASFVEMADLEKGKDIIYVYPASILPNLEAQTTSYSHDGIDYVACPTGFQQSKWTLIQHPNTDKLEVLIDNTLSSLSVHYTSFRATGRIIRKNGTASIYRSFKDLTANPDIQYNYEAEWIHTSDDARNLAVLLNNYYGYCNNTYTFYTEDNLPLGDVVTINENLWSGLNINVLLVARNYVGYGQHKGLFKYTAQAVSSFDLETIVRNTITEDTSLQGPPGPPGEGIIDITYQYATSATQDGQKTQWQDTVPELDPDTHKYLWVRMICLYDDGHTEENISIGAVYGDAGTTVTVEYALTLSGAEPDPSDWSEERDTGWYAGYTYWYRFKYVSQSGTTYSEPALDENMNDIMNNLLSFTIEPSVYSYTKNLRTSNPQSITFTAFSHKYESPVFTWSINGNPYTGSSVTINFTDDTAPSQFDVSCSLLSATNVTAGPLYLTVAATDETFYNDNLGLRDTPPTGSHIDGDCYILHSGNDYIPYIYSEGSWVVISDVSQYPEQMAMLRDTVLAEGVNVPITSNTLYVYFRNLAVQHAQIDTISSSEITLTDTGVIKSSNYTEDANGNPTDGFKISADGTANFVNSNVVDSVVSGSFTSNPLETQDSITGSQVTATFGSQAYYNDYDVHNVIASNVTTASPTTVSGTYGSTPISEVLLLTSDSQRGETRTLASGSGQSTSTTISGTMPVNSNGVSVSGTNIVKQLSLWKGNQTRSSTMEYKNGSGNWTPFTGSVSGLTANKGTTIQARQTVDSSTYSYGSYNTWTSGSILPRNTRVGSHPRQIVIEANNGNLVAIGNPKTIFYSQDRGVTWNSVALMSETTTGDMEAFMKGSSAIICVAKASSSANAGIYRSTDNGVTWTQVLSQASSSNLSNVYWGAYGNGEFRLTTLAYRGYYKSTDDGATWTWVSDSTYGPIVYGNGRFVTCADLGVSGFGYGDAVLTYVNGYFFMVISYSSTQQSSFYANGPIYYSNNGSEWFKTTLFAELGTTSAAIGDNSGVQYANGYYFIVATSRSSSLGSGIWYSDTPYSWTQYSNFIAYSPNLSYVKGRLVYHCANGTAATSVNTDYYNDIGYFPNSEWTLATAGSQTISYNYSSFPIGANLLDSSGGIVTTIANNNNAWHTSPTVISSMSLNPTPYYRFMSFSSPSFDARGYDSQATFNVSFTTYDGTSLNLTSPTSGTYTYNLKWNGTIFNVFLNGSQVGSFDTSDYFLTGANITFTPEVQTDAILVKDIIPKDDSQYSLGIQGKEFATGYVDNMYSTTYHGDLAVPIITSNYTLEPMEVGNMRTLFINSSSTISLTMPGDSSQRYIVMANNVIVMALVSAGKLPHYEAVNGGASLSITWTSGAEPYMLVHVLRIQ